MSDYRRLLTRNKWVILLCALVGAGAALALSLVQDKVYEASASIEFRDIDEQASSLGGGSVTPGETAATLAQRNSKIVTETDVLATARRQTDIDKSISELRDDVSATVDTASNLVVIEAQAPTAGEAADLANAVAKATAAHANGEARAQFRRAANALKKQIDKIPQNVGNIITRQAAQSDLSQLVTLSAVAQPATIVENADPPTSAASPKTTFNVLLGGALGLMLGFGIAFAREGLDTKVRSSEEIAEESRSEVLAEVPDSVMGGAPFLRRNGKVDDRAAMASFGILRRNVELLGLVGGGSRIAITSAAPEEGKTTVALSLACAFANVGRRTALVEADLRRPRLARRLELEPGVGLANYLANGHSLDEAKTTIQVSPRTPKEGDEAQLDCILAGRVQSDPDDLLASSRFREAIRELGESYEAVIIDTSPLLPLADTLEILPLVDSYLVCARVGQTRRDDLKELLHILSRLPKQPLGVVATGLRSADVAGGRGYYQYAYLPE